MNLLKLQFSVTMLLLTLSGGFYTIGFFSDIESSLANVFSAAVLDYDIAGEPLGGLMCSQTETVSTILHAGNIGRCDFEYEITAENLIGDMCGGLEATVSLGTTTLYSGALADLFVSSDVLPIGETDELLFELSFAPGATSTGGCAFETVSTAARTAGLNLGFTDEEVVSHYVYGSASGVGGGCVPDEPWVNLYINKAISGGQQGFELSDFSYHILGDGIDVIAPHDSFTPLPVGTYTIEEIVPEGFVKEDWRIGWYGQCERGTAFITTIEVEERHLDWGTLYCTADNQYRPGHGDNQENEASSPPPETNSRSHNRGSRGSNPRGDETSATSVVITETVTTASTTETNDEEVEGESADETATSTTTVTTTDEEEEELVAGEEEITETEEEEETTEEEADEGGEEENEAEEETDEAAEETETANEEEGEDPLVTE